MISECSFFLWVVQLKDKHLLATVGCIALLRLSHESTILSNAIFEVFPTILLDLARLYESLKASELRRQVEGGVGCSHGLGVTPISRRIVLRVISRLAFSEIKATSNDPPNNGEMILRQLVQAPLGQLRSQTEEPFSADKLYRVCEASLDLSFFSPELVAGLFCNSFDDIRVIFESVITGYSRLQFTFDTDVIWQQVRPLHSAYTVRCENLNPLISTFVLFSGVD